MQRLAVELACVGGEPWPTQVGGTGQFGEPGHPLCQIDDGERTQLGYGAASPRHRGTAAQQVDDHIPGVVGLEGGQVEFVDQLVHPVLRRTDPLTAEFDWGSVGQHPALDASTDPVPRFHHGDLQARLDEVVGCCQPGQTGADDDDVCNGVLIAAHATLWEHAGGAVPPVPALLQSPWTAVGQLGTGDIVGPPLVGRVGVHRRDFGQVGQPPSLLISFTYGQCVAAGHVDPGGFQLVPFIAEPAQRSWVVAHGESVQPLVTPPQRGVVVPVRQHAMLWFEPRLGTERHGPEQ